MMARSIVISCILITLTITSKAQDDIAIYKKLFAYSDSIAKLEQKGTLSKGINTSLKTLDKGHPSAFFETAVKLLKAGKCNDAAYVYYVGYLRYRYLNLANPKYKPEEDGALLGSLQSVVGDPINLFLRSNIDNYIKILEQVKRWVTANDYTFFSKNKNLKKYNGELSQLSKLLDAFTTNKEKYTTQWQTEQTETRKAISEMDKKN